MILAAVDRHHIHVFQDRGDRWQEALTIMAVAVQLFRWLIGRTDQHYALFEHNLQQPTENHCVADVSHEQLIETHHPHFPRQLFGDHGQRLRRAHQLEHALVHPAHEVMKMLTPGRHAQAFEKAVHQPGLAAPDRPPQIDALCPTRASARAS